MSTDRDNIIRMAREAGFDYEDHYAIEGMLMRFAALVAAAEREHVETSRPPDRRVAIERARQEERKACADHYLDIMRKAVEEEREACAQVCESLVDLAEAGKARQRVGYARTAGDEEDELRAMRHELTVSTFNVGIRNCAAAIRARSQT